MLQSPTMRFITLLIFSVFLLPFHLHSQYDDLLRNPDISWLAEYTTEYELNPLYNDNLDEEYNLLEVIRLENTNSVNGLYPDTEIASRVSNNILEKLKEGIFECYSGEQLQQRVSQEELQRLLTRSDTVTGHEHEDWRIVTNEMQAEQIVMFRVRQALYYNASTRELGARLLALAPVIAEHDEEGNVIGYQPLVWIKIPVWTGKTAKKLAKEASYAVQTRMKENAPSMDAVKTVKGSFDPRQWAYGETTRPAHKNLAYETFKPLKPSELQTLIFTNDTIVRFNDAGETEIDRIVQNDATRRVEKIRLVQNWYIDERRGRIDCRVVAAAPLAAVRDSEGNFRYYKPLFYVKY